VAPPQNNARVRLPLRAASNGLRTPDILKTPTKHRRHYSMPQPRRRRRKADRRRALGLAARVTKAGRKELAAGHSF